jgi:hypothetical protein
VIYRRKSSRLAQPTAQTLAIAARTRFVTRKRVMLETFTGDVTSAKHVLVVLERFYALQLADYMRKPTSTVAAWEQHGPLAELQEVRDAVKGDAAWGELVKRYAKAGRS